MAEIKNDEKRVAVECVAVFANYKDVVESLGGVTRVVAKSIERGAVAEVPESEAARLTSLGAVVEPGTASEVHEEALDAYRAARGDQEALARVIARGQQAGDPAVFDAAAASDDQLAAHIVAQKLKVDDTVALAGGDPELAQRVLAAESAANGGTPRKGVVEGLEKVGA